MLAAINSIGSKDLSTNVNFFLRIRRSHRLNQKATSPSQGQINLYETIYPIPSRLHLRSIPLNGTTPTATIGFSGWGKCTAGWKWAFSWSRLDRAGMAMAAGSVCICARILGKAKTSGCDLGTGLLEQYTQGLCLDPRKVEVRIKKSLAVSLQGFVARTGFEPVSPP